MPLLKNRTLDKAPISEFLRDNEEVFHCEMTNEIFRDYDDFAEKTILCNSMVWTCSLTGKANLTYEEALKSEKNARTLLEDFPSNLKKPLLYIATLTNRTSFKDLADDIFSFSKKRFFVGEIVEALVHKKHWQSCKILRVIAPTKEEIESSKSSKGNSTNFNWSNETLLPPTLYKYELKLVDNADTLNTNVTEINLLNCLNIRRKPFSYTSDSNKLFLKQYIESSKGGTLVVKQSAIDDFNLKSVTIDSIFDGPQPVFKKSKQVRQETIASFLTKNKLITNVKEKEKKEKKELKEKTALLLKEWYIIKDDLVLEDHKVLPQPSPIKCLIPDEYVGDTLCVLEFITEFSKVLETRNYFPTGLSMKDMEKALMESKLDSPLIDILQLFINTLFIFQDNENNRYRTTYKKNVDGISSINLESELTPTDASKLANVAYRWCSRYHGISLRELPVLNLTVSEILRLHLVMSGGVVTETCSSWRKANRGGIRSEDDPAVHFRIRNPHIIKALSSHNVVELPIGDKIKLLNCLMEQLLTYEEIRTAAENVREKMRSSKYEIRNIQLNEKKQMLEWTDKMNKLKKGGAFNPNLDKEVEELQAEIDTLKNDNEASIYSINATIIKNTVNIGYDRAYRRYIKLKSIQGLYINSEGLNAGSCLTEPVRHLPQLIGANKEDIMHHLCKSNEEMNTSDKENEPAVKKMNGCSDSLNEKTNSLDELLMCSSDNTNCIVHSNRNVSMWAVFTEPEQFEELIDSLNVRGTRENELKEALLNGKELLLRYIKNTPMKCLNGDTENSRKSRTNNKNEENFGYSEDMPIKDIMCSELILTILEFEEKLYSGSIGGISKTMRDEWRQHLEKMEFDKIDFTIQKHKEYDNCRPNVSEDEDAEASEQSPDVYKDPGMFVGKVKEEIILNGAKTGDDKEIEIIKHLATALVQVAYTIIPDNLRRPMGTVVNKRANEKNKLIKNIILNWKNSLLASTSFSQLFLHFYTLDNCVMWKKSVSCQICRKSKNLTKMLLCDRCNTGHHLYCLKPKLIEVPEGEWFCKVCIQDKEKEKMRNTEEAIRKKEALERRKRRESGKMTEAKEEADVMEFGDFISDSSDDEPVNCTKCGDFEGDEILKCDECPRAYHLLCLDRPLRRVPRGKWVCSGCKELELKKTEGFRRSNRREVESRSDMPLHNVALQELLIDVMKNKNAWPFTRPVQKIEVPDYYNVISKPMDFGTIKYKLNMGSYKYDAEFMADAQLVFDNCNAYNSSDAEVFKCGEKLLKYFSKKCKELNLRTPSDMQIYDDGEEQDEPLHKKRRVM